MPPPPIPPVALTYSAPADAPRRPARLAVLGAADLVVALAGVILNGLALAGIVLVWVAGRMATTAAPPPVPLPLAVPVVPYHGDYVPTGGLAAADRAAVVAAVAARTPLSGDRQAMLERLLAAAGQSVAATPADVLGAGRSNNGPDGSGTLGTQTVTTSAGRLTLDNVAARFTPRDGSPPTTVRGDFVTTGTATAYVPQIIDAAIDDVQRRAARPLNARQASALAEIVHQHVGEPSHDAYGRPTVWANPPGVRLTDPPDPNGPTASAYVEPGVNRHVHVWIYANGRVATIGPGPDPDPLTGGPRVWPAPTPAPRPPPAVDDDLLLGSAVEYAASLAWAGLLGVAGVLLLRGRPVAPRLHGLYVVGKVPLTLASVGLMVAVAQDRVANAPYGLSVSWWPVVLTLLVHLVYPAVIVGVFASAAVVQYAHHQRIDARLLPEPWLRRAAALTPDRWAGRPAAAALAAGLLLLAANGYRLLAEGTALTRSLAFAPTAVVAVVLAVGGAAGLARRRRSAVAALVAVALLFGSASSAAAAPPATRPATTRRATAAELMARAVAAPAAERGVAYRRVLARSDGFRLLLDRLADPAVDPADVEPLTVAVSVWLRTHPDGPIAKADRPVADAVGRATLARFRPLAQTDRGPMFVLVGSRLTDGPAVPAIVGPWLTDARLAVRLGALDALGNARDDSPARWDPLFAALADPATAPMAEGAISRRPSYRRDLRVAQLLASPRPAERARAIRLFHDDRSADPLLPPAVEALVRVLSADDEDADVRAAAATALARYGGYNGPAQLLPELRQPDPARRRIAVRVLNDLPRHDLAVQAIGPLLNDEDPSVRAAADAVMRRVDYTPEMARGGAPDAAAMLAQLGDANVNARVAAARAVATYPALRRALGVRTTAQYARAATERQNGFASPEPPPPPPVTFADVDPVTGLPPTVPTSARSILAGLAAPLARWTTALAWPALAVLVAAVAARGWLRTPRPTA